MEKDQCFPLELDLVVMPIETFKNTWDQRANHWELRHFRKMRSHTL